jgi:hypothetical protein
MGPLTGTNGEYWQKNKPKGRSSGCRLQFGGAKKRPSAFRKQTTKSKHQIQPRP